VAAKWNVKPAGQDGQCASLVPVSVMTGITECDLTTAGQGVFFEVPIKLIIRRGCMALRARISSSREPTCSPAASYRRPARAPVPLQAGRWGRVKPMIDEHFNADIVLALLKEIYLRKGTEAAVEVAKDMISAGAAWIAQESGADEARRILRAVGAAQGQIY
jgi:hypothetical protein